MLEMQQKKKKGRKFKVCVSVLCFSPAEVSFSYWKLFTESLFKCPVIGWKTISISTTVLPPHVRAFFKLTSLFALWRQRCNSESWLLTKQALSPCGATPDDTLHTLGPKILLLQVFKSDRAIKKTKQNGTERTVTLTNAIAKSAENTSFSNSSFLLSLSISLNINTFFQPNCCLYSFLLSRLTQQ